MEKLYNETLFDHTAITCLRYYDVVQNSNIQQPAGLLELFGNGDIGFAGTQIAGWMVMAEQDLCSAKLNGMLVNKPDIYYCTGYSSDTKAAMLYYTTGIVEVKRVE